MVEKMAVDSSPGHRSSHSVETHRTRRSHRSRSRSNERNGTRREKDKERERDKDKDRRRKSRSSGRSERDKERDRDRDRDRDRERRERRSRSRDRHIRERDRERRRERDRDREDRDRERNGHHRDGERERRDRDRDRPERRRRREDDDDDYRAKRLREDDDNLVVTPVNGTSREDGHGRRPRSRDSDRRSVRSVKGDDRPPRRERERERDGKRDDHRGSRVSSPLEEDPQPVSPSRRASPSYDTFEEPREEDSEARSVFVSQLAARMTARDLGYFLEDKLGENSVMDSRIVTDRLSRRSKGIAYVEFRTIELVERAIALTGTIVMGLPIMIQHTEAERNKTHAGDGSINLPPGASSHGATLYVGSLHFNLTDSDIRQVFEPFGELDFVDLHRDPATGRSKGYAFIHYKRAEDAKMALEQMEGFELAGRTLRVNTVHDKGQTRIMTQDSLDESGGGNLNAASRQALMHKLARIDTPPVAEKPVSRPTITQTMTSRSVLLRNAFDPTEETEKDWDKDLGEDVKGECQSKYGNVQYVKVEKDSEGEIYVQFESVETAKAAVEGLNGRWFGGKKLSATFISDAIMQAHR